MKKFRHQAPRPKKNRLVVGRDAVAAALESGVAIERVNIQNNVHGPQIDEIKRLAVEAMVPVHKVPIEKLNYLNVFNHEGCVALLARVQYQDLQQIIDVTVEQGEAPLLVVLDGITDVRNVGAIARSAYAMGVHALVLPEKGVASLNDDAMLTSAGALEDLPVCRMRTIEDAIELMHLNGIRVYATVMEEDSPIASCDFTLPTAIVMGGEEKGIHPSVLKLCDGKCYIPMARDFDSLNVSVATGIVLYEVVKQRGKG